MKPIDQIIEELQQIGIDIPEYIQSGKPENVKAANHRSLETRMNNAILDLVEHIKNLDGDRNVIVGEDDPNTTPPIGAIVGSLYLQKNAAGDNLALYINTGTAEVGWFLFREYTEESKIYGDAPNPNFDSIPGKVGDLYIQTNNGTSTGDILSVWMYIGLAIGDLWFNISAPSGSFNITTKTLTDGQVYNFPSMAKGEAFIVKIIDENTIPAPSGAVWLGGYSGVLTGDGSMVICLTNSPGGTYNDVGHNFAIINQGKNSEIIFVDELPDEHLARTGVIYVLNSNNAMYIWDQQLGDYVLIGDVIPGTLISSTVFEDENNNAVVPEANKLYFDTTSEIYYRWNGSEYVLLNQSDSELVFYTEEMAAQGEEGKLYISTLTGRAKFYNNGWKDLNVAEETMIIPLTAFEEDIEIGETQPITSVFDFKILSAEISCFPEPTGSSIRVDLCKNGSSIIDGNLLEIPENENNSTGLQDVSLIENVYNIGDRLNCFIEDIGTITPGQNLHLTLKIKKI